MSELYSNLIEQYKSLIEGEKDFFVNASNLNALLFNQIDNINWVGFYMNNGSQLVLSTFQGKPACRRIEMGKGVCGKCASLRKTLIVDNVHNFEGHIACDSASNSEITIPLILNNELYGVFDLDSPIFSRFTDDDNHGLEDLLKILVNGSDMNKLKNYYIISN